MNRNLDLVFARVEPRENMWWKEESFAVHWSLHSTKKTFSLMNSTKLPLWGDERSCLTFSSYYTQGSHNRSSQKLVCLQIYHNQTRQYSSIFKYQPNLELHQQTGDNIWKLWSPLPALKYKVTYSFYRLVVHQLHKLNLWLNKNICTTF